MAPKKRKNRNWPHPRDSSEDPKIAEEIEALFDKKFVLKSKDASWNLPPSSSLFTEERPFILEEMMIMKDRLNQTKSLLNDFDIVQWHQHTRRVNKTGLVVKHLRQELQVEMCTQAWAKFHEILNTYDLIPEEATEAGELFSVHLCEAPGAFVASLNHFLKSRRPQLKWDWLASTLNPYYEGHDLKAMLDDDGFVLETLDHWNFGRDGTGDLMDLANLQALRDASNAKGKVHLVTADGSINCADQPAEQERLVAQLIYCETVAALMILSRGGSYVFKIFTALEHQMVCLMYLLSNVFGEVHMIKPATSKAGNSEVYVVGLNYIGMEHLPEGYIGKLQEHFSPKTPTCGMFYQSSIPPNFLEILKTSQEHFTGLQIDAISMHVKQFTWMSQWEKRSLSHMRQYAMAHFVARFHIVSIPREEHVVPRLYLDGTQLSYTRCTASNMPLSESFSGRHQTGTFNERQEQKAEKWLDSMVQDDLFIFQESESTSLKRLCSARTGAQLIPLAPAEVEWLQKPPKDLTAKGIHLWKPQVGLKVEELMNSRFCSPSYITNLRAAQAGACILRQENTVHLSALLDRISPSQLWNDDTSQAIVLASLVNFESVKDGLVLGVNLEPSSSGFPAYFKNSSIKFKALQVDTDITRLAEVEGSKVSAIISRIPTPPSCSPGGEELASKQSLLLACKMALQHLSREGSLILRIHQTLTRFTVGMLFILHHCFREIAAVKPITMPLHTSDRYVICKNFCGCEDNVLLFLKSVCQQYSCLKASRDVLEIVPVHHLYDEPFYHFFKKQNEQLSHLQLQSIVHLEQLHQHPSSIPAAEHVSKLKEEVVKHIQANYVP